MFESMRCACRSAVMKSRFEKFQKRGLFPCALPEVEAVRQFSRHLGVILGFTILVIALTDGNAQSGGATGTMVGTVADSTGALIAGADVSIIEADTNVTVQTTTSSSGSFTTASLKPGTYRVAARASGFSTTTVQNVVLIVGSQVRVDLRLTHNQPGSRARTARSQQRWCDQWAVILLRIRDIFPTAVTQAASVWRITASSDSGSNRSSAIPAAVTASSTPGP